MNTAGMSVDDLFWVNNTAVGLNHIQTIAVHLNGANISLTNWRIENDIFYQCSIMNGAELINFDPGSYTAGTDVITDYNIMDSGVTYVQPHSLAGTSGFVSYSHGAQTTPAIYSTAMRSSGGKGSIFPLSCLRRRGISVLRAVQLRHP